MCEVSGESQLVTRGSDSIALWFESAAAFNPLQGFAHLTTSTGSRGGCQSHHVSGAKAEVQRDCVLEHLLVWDTEE